MKPNDPNRPVRMERTPPTRERFRRIAAMPRPPAQAAALSSDCH